jgi:hypothetical protein
LPAPSSSRAGCEASAGRSGCWPAPVRVARCRAGREVAIVSRSCRYDASAYVGIVEPGLAGSVLNRREHQRRGHRAEPVRPGRPSPLALPTHTATVWCWSCRSPSRRAMPQLVPVFQAMLAARREVAPVPSSPGAAPLTRYRA